MGTASSNPGTPHIQPQNITEMNTATEFTLAARPSTIGVSKYPSSDVIATDVPATAATIGISLNCIRAATADPTMTAVGPKYGMQFRKPAATPHKPA